MNKFTTYLGHNRALQKNNAGAKVLNFPQKHVPSEAFRDAIETVRLGNAVIQATAQQYVSTKGTNYFTAGYQDLHDARNHIISSRPSNVITDALAREEILAMLHGVACASAEILASIPDAQNEWAAADNLRDLLSTRRSWGA